MEIWMANSMYGLDFDIENRHYRNLNIFGYLIPWRRKLYKAGIEAILNPWVEKYGITWEEAKKKNCITLAARHRA